MSSGLRNQFVSHVEYFGNYPKPTVLKKIKPLVGCESFLLIYDRLLLKQPEFVEWKNHFPLNYEVVGGEALKDLKAFSKHVEKIMEVLGEESPKTLGIIAVGGGTVGDFAGFFASVFKRGVRLIQMPTTWLSVLDSAHGGKTALNVGGIKNQIGSFYPPATVCIVRRPLEHLPEIQVLSGYGELIKMAYLDGGRFYKSLMKSEKEGAELIWSFLPEAIRAKYKVVKKDPFEEKGERQILNLGHTFGHVLESHYKIPHGVAVGLGLRFALNWSRKRNYLTKGKFSQMLEGLDHFPQYKKSQSVKGKVKLLEAEELERLLLQDKKRSGKGSVTFIFMNGVGKPVRKSVTAKQLVSEAKRQGWV